MQHGEVAGQPRLPSARRAAKASVIARHISVRVARSAARRTGSVPHRYRAAVMQATNAAW